MVRKVVWSPRAMQQLEKAYEYILKDSFQNAEKVREDILDSTRKIVNHPEIYAPDKYRKNNDGSFRAYELHHYRIAYQITTDKIIIVRVRHTKMEPRQY
jgi:plasmid stabilization system protein ParE